jgi:hypothetical protein
MMRASARPELVRTRRYSEFAVPSRPLIWIIPISTSSDLVALLTKIAEGSTDPSS